MGREWVRRGLDVDGNGAVCPGAAAVGSEGVRHFRYRPTNKRGPGNAMRKGVGARRSQRRSQTQPREARAAKALATQ